MWRIFVNRCQFEVDWLSRVYRVNIFLTQGELQYVSSSEKSTEIILQPIRPSKLPESMKIAQPFHLPSAGQNVRRQRRFRFRDGHVVGVRAGVWVVGGQIVAGNRACRPDGLFLLVTLYDIADQTGKRTTAPDTAN